MRGILIVTEDPRGVSAIQSALVREGYRVTVTPPGELEGANPEVAVVDCTGDMGSVTQVRRTLQLPELLTVALLAPEQLPTADWAGIDCFLAAPAEPTELLARIRHLLFREKNIDGDQIVKIGSLALDMANYDISVDGVPVELTFKEYELLSFLATHRGRVFTREALLDHVWGWDYYGGTRTVDVHIRRIRSKLGPCEEQIETVRNVGYRFRAE
ncbi:MAG: winged helix-turn-helix domain-containing protein [Armatimonadota bacterium]